MEENITLSNMRVGDVLDYSIEIYKKNFKQLTLLTLTFYTPFILLITFVTNSFYGDMLDFTNFVNPTSIESSADIPFKILAVYLSIFIIGIFYIVYWISLKGVMDASIIRIVFNDIVYRKKLKLKDVIKDSFGDFKNLLINKVLYGLIIFGVYLGAYIAFIILIMIITFGSVFLFRDAIQFGVQGISRSWTVILAVFIGLIVLALILGLLAIVFYFMAKYSIGVHSVTIERKTGVEGISRCNDLGKKSFWYVALSYVFGNILFYFVPVIINYIVVGLNMFYYDNYKLVQIISGSFQVLFSILAPFLTTLLTVLFISLKIRNEGFDLELKFDKMIQAADEGEKNEK